MGSVESYVANKAESIGKQVEEKAKAIPKGMQETQREMMLKSRELQMAVSVAQARDLFQWLSVWTGTLWTGGILRTVHTRNPVNLLPAIPFSLVTAYQYDFVYGTKIQRVTNYAEYLLENEPERFMPPANNLLVTQEEYEKIILSKHKKD